MARTRRELKAYSVTVSKASRWKSILFDTREDEKSETKLNWKLKLVEQVETFYNPKDVVGYYWGLRTWAYANGMTGNYEVDSRLEK